MLPRDRTRSVVIIAACLLLQAGCSNGVEQHERGFYLGSARSSAGLAAQAERDASGSAERIHVLHQELKEMNAELALIAEDGQSAAEECRTATKLKPLPRKKKRSRKH